MSNLGKEVAMGQDVLDEKHRRSTEGDTMATRHSLLFSWDDVERLPELKRLGFVLDNLPDAELVGALESRRGRGRDEYPVSAMWRALVAEVVFGHDSAASLLRELGRNPALLGVCGFDPLGRQARRRGGVSGGRRAAPGRWCTRCRRGATGCRRRGRSRGFWRRS